MAAGMIAELSKPDQGHLIRFFKAMTKQDGEMLGDAILAMSEKHTCKVSCRGLCAAEGCECELLPATSKAHLCRVCCPRWPWAVAGGREH